MFLTFLGFFHGFTLYYFQDDDIAVANRRIQAVAKEALNAYEKINA